MTPARTPAPRSRLRPTGATHRRIAGRRRVRGVARPRAAGCPAAACVPAFCGSLPVSPAVQVVPAPPARFRRSALRALPAPARVARSHRATSPRKRRTVRAAAAPGAPSVVRCAAPALAVRCARLATRPPGVRVLPPAAAILPHVLPRAAAAGRAMRPPCAAMLQLERHRHVRIFQYRFASDQVLICVTLPFPDAMCAPARASRCLPAASTVAPRSATPCRLLPAAR